MSDDLGRLARRLRGEDREPADDEQPVELPPLPKPFTPPPKQHYPIPTYEIPDYEQAPPPDPEPRVEVPAPAPVAKVLLVGWALLLSMVWPPWTLVIGVVVGIALWANRN